MKSQPVVEARHNADVLTGVSEFYALGMGAAASGAVLEPLQTDAQNAVSFQQQFEAAVGAHVNHGFDLTHILANAPDFRSLTLSLAVLASFKAASVAQRLRHGAEAPDQSRGMRLMKKAGYVALAGAAAFGAYRAGSMLTPTEAEVLGIGTTGAAAVYMHASQIGAHGRNKARRSS